MKRTSIALVALLLLLAPAPRAGAAQQTERNIKGIHTLAASRRDVDQQLTWARSLVGPGGYVTQPFLGIDATTAGPSPDATYYVEQAYARDLNPILVLQGRFVNRDGCNSTGYVGWLAPTPDGPEGGYLGEARGYAAFVAGLPRTEGRALHVQIGNEPNLHEMWGGTSSPAAYARFFADVSAAIREIGDPRIRVLNAALAPEGNVDNLQFIAEAIESDPRFATSFDDWASHPYPRNRPPASNLHDGTAEPGSRYAIDSYLLELGALAANGVDTTGVEVVLTETGYELGDRHHSEYPAITEELRAAYIRAALERHWPRWPEVKAVTPFELAGWYGSWRSFDWVHPSSTTTPHGFPTQPRLQYARLVPGVGMVAGTALDDRGTPLKDVTIVSEPDGHRARTLADGTFILLAPPGRYALTAEKDRYSPLTLRGVAVSKGQSTTVGMVLASRLAPTLANVSFESGDLAGWTTWGDVDGVESAPWFFDMAAKDGASFLGTAVNCGAKDGGVQQSVSAQVGSSVTTSVWTLTHRDGSAPIGNRIGIDPWGGSDPEAGHVVWSPWSETGGAWQRVSVAARARADRVTVFLEHDQDASNPWNVSAFDGVELTVAP
ncbi:MAG TPA: carboxypeptidase regulatory-like domain-containing protein [Chloroflexota bacterium]|nr:carboxypeptidase regulatory-like domain-containing protein [Chloroflexota bacterium]